jgi:hypothetical protein
MSKSGKTTWPFLFTTLKLLEKCRVFNLPVLKQKSQSNLIYVSKLNNLVYQSFFYIEK